jgi:glutamine cyclotransferase
MVATTALTQPLRTIATTQPQLLASLPANSTCFTQGLELYQDHLYQSCGAPSGKTSSLIVSHAKNGTLVSSKALPGFFAEGLTILDDTLFLLSWQEQTLRAFTLPALKQVRTASYRGEGWGVAALGEGFVMSNGSDTLTIRDRSFAIKRTIAVTLQGKPLSRLNELEYAKGSIWANIWYSPIIVQIDPASGRVVRSIDCSALMRQAGPLSTEQVLNGIAYNKARDSFYITGKEWKVLFEVRM